MADGSLHEQRHERTGVEIHAVPAHGEGLVPLGAIAVDDAATSSNAGVVEQQVHVRAPLGDSISKRENLFFARDVGDYFEDLAGVAIFGAHCRRLAKVLTNDVAHRNVAAVGSELANELATHARACAGNDRDATCKTVLEPFAHDIAPLTDVAQRTWPTHCGRARLADPLKSQNFRIPASTQCDEATDHCEIIDSIIIE